MNFQHNNTDFEYTNMWPSTLPTLEQLRSGDDNVTTIDGNVWSMTENLLDLATRFVVSTKKEGAPRNGVAGN
jgi:hypothetical protein